MHWTKLRRAIIESKYISVLLVEGCEEECASPIQADFQQKSRKSSTNCNANVKKKKKKACDDLINHNKPRGTDWFKQKSLHIRLASCKK